MFHSNEAFWFFKIIFVCLCVLVGTIWRNWHEFVKCYQCCQTCIFIFLLKKSFSWKTSPQLYSALKRLKLLHTSHHNITDRETYQNQLPLPNTPTHAHACTWEKKSECAGDSSLSLLLSSDWHDCCLLLFFPLPLALPAPNLSQAFKGCSVEASTLVEQKNG